MLINVQVQIVPPIYSFAAAESLIKMLVNIQVQIVAFFLAFFKKSSNLRQKNMPALTCR